MTHSIRPDVIMNRKIKLLTVPSSKDLVQIFSFYFKPFDF